MIRLNLIPQNKKEEIIQASRFRKILKWEFELAGIAMTFIFILLSMNYILKLNLESIQDSADQDSGTYQQIEEVIQHDAEIKTINSRLSEIRKVISGQLRWSDFFLHLNGDIPTGAAVNSLATNGYHVTMLGNAKNRETYIMLKENFEKDTCFENLNFPLSNLVTKDNVDFQISFDIKKECLKK